MFGYIYVYTFGDTRIYTKPGHYPWVFVYNCVEVKDMNKSYVYAIVILTIVWLVLRENFSLYDAVAGVVIGICTMYFYHRFLPYNKTLDKMKDINYFRLLIYFVFLIEQIYVTGFYVIKLIIMGAKMDIVHLKTKITNDALRVILANSVTLTPGSISLELDNDKLTVLWIRKKNDTRSNIDELDKSLKGFLESKLLQAEKRR